jgi:hypothetical protein
MDGHAALFAAAEAGNLDHLNTALRSGVDVNFVDEVGCVFVVVSLATLAPSPTVFSSLKL